MSSIINYISIGFMILGIIDMLLFKNRFELGRAFKDGLELMGNLIYIMTGLMVMAPVFGNFIGPIIGPLLAKLNIDPAMIGGIVTAIDMGAYPLAESLTSDLQIMAYSGIIIASMLGVTFVFVIPTSLEMTGEADTEYLGLGIAIGLISIFPGAIIGGLMIGMSLSKIFINSWPIFIMITILAYLLIKKPEAILKVFGVFGKIMNLIIALSFINIVINLILGVELIKNMPNVEEQLIIVTKIAMIMAGIYPLFTLITNVFKSGLDKIASKLKIDPLAVLALISGPVNSFIVFETISKIDKRGKVLAMAFSTPIGAAFTAHMAYALEVSPEHVGAMIISKIVSGIFAFIIAHYYTKPWVENNLPV